MICSITEKATAVLRMQEFTVTVRTLDGTGRKTTEVPLDMTLGDFREAAAEILGLSGIPTSLVDEKTNQVFRDGLTFQESNIENGAVFVLVPEAEGGGVETSTKKVNELFLRVTYRDKFSEVSVPEDATVYFLMAATFNNLIKQGISNIEETNNYKALLKRTNEFLKKTNTLAQESVLDNDELIIVHDLEDPIDRLKLGYRVPQNAIDRIDISAPVSIPKREDMTVSLVPADIVYRLEEYRSDQQHWESIMWTLVGAILGVLVNWATSDPLVVSKVSVIILVIFFVFTSIALTSAIRYRRRAEKMKERMMNSMKSSNAN
jgi:hypothetical protein